MVIRVGNKIQRLGIKSAPTPPRHKGTQARSPIGTNVEEDNVVGSVVTNVAITAEIFLSDIEDGLGERHEVCRETEKRGDRGIKGISRKQVKSVDNKLHEVEGG